MRILYILLSLLLLFSCKENKTEKNEIENELPPVGKERVESSKNESFDLGGIWINKKYVAKLLESKSPKKSQGVVPIPMMVIPQNINSEATLILEFHEGTPAEII